MAIDLNDEIVQDFLVEAGEILEKLTNQVVELESRPGDRDLLNAVFRSFHTIKGGAGFLQLEHLVEVSHKAEDVFDLLRRGERAVDAALMDIILQVLDQGTCQGILEVPESVREVFVVSQDVRAEEHVRLQASLQAFVDNSLSKT